MNTPSLQLYARLAQTRTLGPGVRYALWLQGCPFRCPACMTPGALPFDGGDTVPIAQLAADINATPNIEGLTLSGGEPFAQAAGLCQLMTQIQSQQAYSIIIYSGYRYAQLQRAAQGTPAIAQLLAMTDVLIDGLYVDSLNDGRSLRGSSNQQVHALTPRYQAVIADYYGQAQRQIELHLLDHEAFLAGIPGADMLAQWQKLSTQDP